MSLGTNGAAAAQLHDPEVKNEFADAQTEMQAQAEADAAAAQKAPDVQLTDGQLMAAAASDSPASAA